MKEFPRYIERPNNKPDWKAWDGVFYRGWRKVRAPGVVKAAGCWFREKNTDFLKDYIGCWFIFTMGEYWCQHGHLSIDGNVLCSVEAYDDPRNK